ncbi:MAG: DUF2911 domain-containing protein [Maribacter sp.]
MKLIKKLVIIVLVIAGLIYFVGIPYIQKETKKFSPYKTSQLEMADAEIEVKYSSPTKKGRVIFGELVPFGQIWRTGANEPTTFSNTKDIKIIDKSLPAGRYSLWTIPGKSSWKVIFNTKIPDWGVTRVNGNQTTHESKHDLVTVEVPVAYLENPVEELFIGFTEKEERQKEQEYFQITWDTSNILIPIFK